MVSDVLPDLLAIIFCIFSVNYKNPGSTYKDFEHFKSLHYHPEPAIIIAIFRMFGLGYSNKKGMGKQLFNNIIDMDLKEENGIVISVTASIFALYEHQVSCACSNEYICIRETNKYDKLFSILKVSPLIRFKTLPYICESFIKSSNGT
jgi:hypothetical protein